MSEKLKEQQLIDFDLWRELLRAEAAAFPIVGASASGTTLYLDLIKRLRELFRPVEISAVEDVSGKEPRSVERQKPESVEVRGMKFRELERERDNLQLQIQLLQSQLAEARRTAGRETQRYDQLQVQNDMLLDCLKVRDKTIGATMSLLLERQNLRLRMIEWYEGVVEHVHGDSATIVFEIDDDIVEHTYRRSQFIDGQLPEEGDRITVYVHVVHGSVESTHDSSKETDELDEHPEYERKKITGPIEF